MKLKPIHRVVTGHDKNGKAVVIAEGPLPHVAELQAVPGVFFHEVWNTSGGVPVQIFANEADPTLAPLTLVPPSRGTRIRFVDQPPDTAEFLARGRERMHAVFSQTGDAAASTVNADSPHPLMHRTQSVDYGIVIEGEITLILDDSEVALRPGSVVIQRGTNHAWANRSDKPCRMLFILIDGEYDSELAAAIEGRSGTS